MCLKCIMGIMSKQFQATETTTFFIVLKQIWLYASQLLGFISETVTRIDVSDAKDHLHFNFLIRSCWSDFRLHIRGLSKQPFRYFFCKLNFIWFLCQCWPSTQSIRQRRRQKCSSISCITSTSFIRIIIVFI